MYTNDTYRRITYKWDRPCEKPADQFGKEVFTNMGSAIEALEELEK